MDEPDRQHRPTPLSYARPDADRDLRPTGKMPPALAFLIGLIAPYVVGWVWIQVSMNFRFASTDGMILVLTVIGTPIVLCTFDATRIYGAGWLTGLCLAPLAFCIICGAIFR